MTYVDSGCIICEKETSESPKQALLLEIVPPLTPAAEQRKTTKRRQR